MLQCAIKGNKDLAASTHSYRRRMNPLAFLREGSAHRDLNGAEQIILNGLRATAPPGVDWTDHTHPRQHRHRRGVIYRWLMLVSSNSHGGTTVSS